MSRPKSPERIQADIDKAIRKERLECKRKEREAKRTARARKRATHEHVIQNGIPKVQSYGQEFGVRDAIAYSPLMFCARCGRLARSNEFIAGLCESCHYGKEVQPEKHNQRKEQIGDKPTGVAGPPEAK